MSTFEPDIPQRVILRATVGSTAHGLNVGDGVDDRDEMGVCLESMDEALGLEAPFEQVIWRSAAVREGKHDARSRAGDLDLTIYSLRKYVRLALKGNPTVLILLFAEPLQVDALGRQLQEFAPDIISREAGKAFLGYLIAQKQRLQGERGGMDVTRPELIKMYGFDTKYAMHAIRLGMQGIELLTTGRMVLPIHGSNREYLRGVREGKISFNGCLQRIGELERELKDLLTSSPIREFPRASAIQRWMLECYLEHWKCEDYDRRIAEYGQRNAQPPSFRRSE